MPAIGSLKLCSRLRPLDIWSKYVRTDGRIFKVGHSSYSWWCLLGSAAHDWHGYVAPLAPGRGGSKASSGWRR